MSFHDINEEFVSAQNELEKKIMECVNANNEFYAAKMKFIEAESRLRGLRLELKLYQGRIDSLKEQGWNLRKEAGLK